MCMQLLVPGLLCKLRKGEYTGGNSTVLSIVVLGNSISRACFATQNNFRANMQAWGRIWAFYLLVKKVWWHLQWIGDRWKLRLRKKRKKTSTFAIKERVCYFKNKYKCIWQFLWPLKFVPFNAVLPSGVFFGLHSPQSMELYLKNMIEPSQIWLITQNHQMYHQQFLDVPILVPKLVAIPHSSSSSIQRSQLELKQLQKL